MYVYDMCIYIYILHLYVYTHIHRIVVLYDTMAGTHQGDASRVSP